MTIFAMPDYVGGQFAIEVAATCRRSKSDIQRYDYSHSVRSRAYFVLFKFCKTSHVYVSSLYFFSPQ